MHKLIKGAETASTSDQHMKLIPTGDLGNAIQKGSFLLGQSTDSTGFVRLKNESDDDDDFTSIDILFSPLVNKTNGFLTYPVTQINDNINYSTFAYVDTSIIQSSDQLESHVKFLEFRKIFALNINDVITEEELSLHLYDKVKLIHIQGNLYFSRHSIHFASVNTPGFTTSLSKLVQQITPLSSLLFDSSCDCVYTFTLPPSYIVSLKKTSILPSGSKGQGFLLVAHLIIHIRSQKEIILSFSNIKSRDRVHDLVLQRIKNVDINAADFIIGERNGVSSNERNSVCINELRGRGSFDSIEKIGNNSGNQYINTFKVPLKYLFESPFTPPQSYTDPNLKLWLDYFDQYGRDACMIKNVRVIRDLLVKTTGIPTVLRGDFWLLSSGAWYTRPENDDYYSELLKENSKKLNPFADEIEKDVPRSLPEHHAYQTKIGLDALRRILVSYSFRNPAIGYAQALNIISANLLLHLCEEDAFWLLCTIVEKILPDHYTKTLVGSVVDQQIFTHLVGLFMPTLTNHMLKYFMELSTFTVPWFVCIYLNTLSLKINAVTLDAFFLDGPKFIQWFGLAILKLNEKKLLCKKDDELFMNVFKNFFGRLEDESSCDEDEILFEGTVSNEVFEKLKGRTLMQYTLWTAYTHFSPHVTNEMFDSLRVKYMLKVVHEMEQSYQKSQIRTICESVKLSSEEVEIVYNQLRQLEFLRDDDPDAEFIDRNLTDCMIDWISEMGGWGCKSINRNPKSEHQKTNKNIIKKAILLKEFRVVFQKVSPWRETMVVKIEKQRQSNTGLTFRRPSAIKSSVKRLPDDYQISITDRLFFYTAFHQKPSLDQTEFMIDLGDVILILDTLYKQSLQIKLRFFFDLHDINGDGYLNKNELKALMDSLLEMFDKMKNKVFGGAKEEELYLRAVSAFLGIALKSGKSHTDTQEERFSKSRNTSVNFMEERGRVGRMSTSDTIDSDARSKSRHRSANDEDTYRLGFHEFLLSIMSQSVFVEYFETIWTLILDDIGRIRLDKSNT